MSDIPVGSPPVPPGRHAAPGGWYVDPVDAGQERYWDGWQWSRNTRPRAGGQAASSGVPGAGPTPPYVAGVAPRPLPGARQVPVTADGVRLAAWGWRVLAALIDLLLVSTLASLLTFPIYAETVEKLTLAVQAYLSARQAGEAAAFPDVAGAATPQQQLITTIALIAVGLTYHVIALRWKRATLGKLVVGLRVVPVDQGHFTDRLEWSAIIIRAAIWVVPGAVGALVFLLIADALFPLWHPKRQALHDLAARTQVVRPGAR